MAKKKRKKKERAETASNSRDVGVPSSAYEDMLEHWHLIDALEGGTLAMRAGGEDWLPRETKESPAAYDARLERSVLFNGYSDTVSKTAARPFSKPVTLTGDDNLPDQLAGIKNDADGEGTSLTQLGRELFREGLNRGVVHMIVDYPRLNGDETKAQEQESGARPTFVPLKTPSVIGWRSVTDGGVTRLTQLRISETGEEESGPYGTSTVNRVRVWTETTWELWRQHEKKMDSWTLEAFGDHSFGAIPLVTAYFKRTGFMTAKPPMEDLAWLNLAHWQSASDQRNILRFARTGLWFVKGMSKKDFEKVGGLTLGPNQAFCIENADSDVKVVEHSGSSIEMGAKDVRDLEERMELMGLQPFVRLSGYQTATGKAIDEGRNQTEVQAWARAIEQMLLDAYHLAARWIKQPDATADLGVDVYSDFGIGPRISADVDALIRARVAKEIDRETFLRELRKRAVLSEDESIEDIIERLEDEGPDLSAMTLGGGPGAPNVVGGGEEQDEGEE
jgi:hypothetical protein